MRVITINPPIKKNIEKIKVYLISLWLVLLIAFPAIYRSVA